MPVRKKHDRGGEVKEKEKEESNHDKIKLDKQNYKNREEVKVKGVFCSLNDGLLFFYHQEKIVLCVV